MALLLNPGGLHSNFFKVASLKHDTTTRNVMKHLKENIARYGIFDTLISDNGPQYTSPEFKSFIIALVSSM